MPTLQVQILVGGSLNFRSNRNGRRIAYGLCLGFESTDFAPIRASPRMIAVRVKMASGQIWDAAFVNKAKSSSDILMETPTVRLGITHRD